MRGRWAAQVGLVVLFCAIGALLVLLPRLVHRPPAELPSAPSLSHAPPSSIEIRRALSGIEDPELGIGIVDLGLVREVRVEKQGTVSVTLLFTSPFCPMSEVIVRRVKAVLSALEGVQDVEVTVDRRSVWSPELMSEEARDKLKGYFP